MPDEIEPLIDYLAATYGPGATPPAVGGEVSQAGSALPDGPGRAIFVGNCAACHSMDLPLNMRQSEAEWNATISQMVSYGAQITPQEQEILVKYAPGVSKNEIAELNASHGNHILEMIPELGIYRLSIPANKAESAMINGYTRNPRVEYAEPNYNGKGGDFFPTDTFFFE